MAGLNVGMSNMGSFRGMPETKIPKPTQPEQSQRMSRGNFRNNQERGRGKINSAPSMGGGINVGRTSNMGILPSAMDPYRTYGSVSGGRMTPPADPYGQNQPIRFTPGGEYGGGGPSSNFTPPPMMGPRDGNFGGMNTPLMPPGGGSGATTWQNPTNPYLERGGFTGGQMPQSGSAGISAPSTPIPEGQLPYTYGGPLPGIPNMPQGMNRPSGGFGAMYGGGGNRFRGGLFY